MKVYYEKKLNARKRNSRDKNLQDDWLPDQKRDLESTSRELPEFGIDLMRRDAIDEYQQKRSRKLALLIQRAHSRGQ